MRSTSSIVASCGRLTVLLIAPLKNGCAAAIMRTWLIALEEALADLAATVGAVEHREVLVGEVRRALDRHATDHHVVDLVDLMTLQARSDAAG